MVNTKGISAHRLLLLLFLTLMLQAAASVARDIPSLSARVNDYAAMLSPATRQQLESVLAALEKEDRHNWRY